ncbi:hypothetical protein KUCAC02_027846 [Chaenocephalus aceratus]|nr:hypothetical protein KUCAC02_027846 [Chaenocephalus aceratus]
MDYKRRFLLGGSKQKVQQQHQQYQMPELSRTLSASAGLLVLRLLAPGRRGGDAGQLPPASLWHNHRRCRHPARHLQISGCSQRVLPASAFLTDLFSSVFRNSHYSKAAMQLKDVQEHVHGGGQPADCSN